MKPRNIALLLGMAAFAVIIAVIAPNRGHSPAFYRPGKVGLAEMLAQPPSYLYGSSINIFIYRDDADQIREIDETGHADSDTCAQASGLIAGAMLAKARTDGDFFNAGSARLIGADYSALDSLKQDQNVLEYDQLSNELALFERIGLPQADGRKELDELKRRVKALEADHAVRQYADLNKTLTTLNGLQRDLTDLAARSGLVRIHVLPYSVLEKARARIAKAVAAGKPAVVTFDDLLPPGAQSEGVVMFQALALADRKPVSLAYNDERLTSDSFQKAAEEDRSDLESTMVGDARGRLERQQKELKNVQDEIDGCKSMTETQLDQSIDLNMTCTIDGCFPSDHTTTITQRNYCTQTLPQSITYWQGNIADTTTLIDRIAADRKSANASRIDAMSLGTMIDSMLRDWELPIGRNQNEFDRWRSEERAPAWAELTSLMADKGMKPAAFSGESVLFMVDRAGGKLNIVPVDVIDLKRSVLVIDPALGATTVVSAWSLRTPKESSPGENPRTVVARVAQHGASERDRTALMAALASDPNTAFADFIASYNALYADRRQAGAPARAAALSQMAERDFSTAWSAISDRQEQQPANGDTLEQYLEILRDRETLAAGFGHAPPETELTIARDASGLLALLLNGRNKTGPYTSWSVIKLVRDGTDDDHLKAASDRLAAKYFVNVFDIARSSLLRARLTDAAFVDASIAAGEILSTPSPELARLTDILGAQRSLDDVAAIEQLAAERMLQSASHLGIASDRIVDDPPDYAAADSEIATAIKISKAVQIGPAMSARYRIQQMRGQDSVPLLSRLEVSTALTGGAHLIKTQFEVTQPYDLSQVTTDPDGHAIVARMHYDASEYELAMADLFPHKTILALADPTMTVTAASAAPLDSITAVLAADGADGSILVTAQAAGRTEPVATLRSRDPSQMQRLLAGLAAVPPGSWGKNYALWEQLERLTVPLSPKQAAVQAFLEEPDVRLALLKAMVYGCAVPVSKLAPVSGRCDTGEDTRQLDQIATDGKPGGVNVPSLHQLVAGLTADMTK